MTYPLHPAQRVVAVYIRNKLMELAAMSQAADLELDEVHDAACAADLLINPPWDNENDNIARPRFGDEISAEKYLHDIAGIRAGEMGDTP